MNLITNQLMLMKYKTNQDQLISRHISINTMYVLTCKTYMYFDMMIWIFELLNNCTLLYISGFVFGVGGGECFKTLLALAVH